MIAPFKTIRVFDRHLILVTRARARDGFIYPAFIIILRSNAKGMHLGASSRKEYGIDWGREDVG